MSYAWQLKNPVDIIYHIHICRILYFLYFIFSISLKLFHRLLMYLHMQLSYSADKLCQIPEQWLCRNRKYYEQHNAFVDIPVIANSFGRKMEQPKVQSTEPTHTQPRSQLNGSQILNRIINPTMARSIVPAVEMSVSPSPNVCPKTAMAATASTSVRPAGRAFNTTICQEMSFDHIFIRLECQEESRNSDGKHAD